MQPELEKAQKDTEEVMRTLSVDKADADKTQVSFRCIYICTALYILLAVCTLFLQALHSFYGFHLRKIKITASY